MNDLQVEVNGQLMSLSLGTTVDDLVDHLHLDRPGVAVAVNHTVIPRSQRHHTVLKPKDCIEVIHAVGGG